MPDVVITEFMDAAAVAALQAQFDTLYDPGLVDRPEELQQSLGQARALVVRNRTRVTQPLLDHAPALQVVGRLGVGLDNIDMPACEARNVSVIPAIGANARAVAEYVVCTAMVLLRGAYQSTREVADGSWPRPALSQGRELGDKTLGLVGFGGIGQLTARMARALGMEVIAHDPHLPAAPEGTGVALVGLDELLGRADVVSLHLPLTDQTRNLFDRTALSAMRAGAVLINTARGGIVDEEALAELLHAGHLGGAALDVYAHEPLAANNPLSGAPNLVLTPHVAGVTRESNERVSAMIAERVAAFLQP
ncbi:MAG TPA: hydroxyacid dehydrogenase [Gammaproteobacteria bacterium]|nr:hydroxyacid dehydrogenase [Gammaproteobacteria bacterium]